MQAVNELVWVERYRPKTIEDCILPPRLKEVFQGIVDSGEMQNMTLVGPAGTGKTTIAGALCEEMGMDSLLINASKERNIDTIRTDVIQFGSTASLMSDMKCILLDEADGLNAQSAQPALRGVIEELLPNCRFLLTANFGNKLIEPLLSRCPVIDVTFTKEERKDMILAFGRRAKAILKENDVEFDPSELAGLIVKNFPDFRKTLNLLQRYSATGKLSVQNVLSLSDDALQNLVLFLSQKDFGKMRKWVVENIDNDSGMLRNALYTKAFDLVEPESIPELILLLNKYDYQEGFVMNKEVNTVAMMTEIMASVAFK